jgi:putative oxidoreductase
MSVTSSDGMRGSPRLLGAWALQGVMAATFFAAGAAKLAGVPFMIEIFDQIGVGQWFRIVTGVVEIGGAFALVYPGMAAMGGLWLGFTMVCAVATHVFVLHSSPAPAAVLLALNALIIYLRRDELVSLAIKAQSGQRQYPS